MGDIAALLERVEAATGPDHEIDCEIAQALEFETTFSEDDGACFVRFQPGALMLVAPACTASVDAALALVERKLPGWTVVNLCEWDADVLRERGPWLCILKQRGTQDDLRAASGRCDHAPSPALAIIAAALSALQALKDSSHE